MKIEKTDYYLITENTYYLKSNLEGGRNHTFIMDEQGVYECPKSITRVISSSCKEYGFTVEQAHAQSKRFFKQGQNKLPRVLAYELNIPIVFFSVSSPRHTVNTWLNCNKIIGITKKGPCDVIVTFPNFATLEIPMSYSSFCSFYVRATFYQTFLRKKLPNYSTT